MRTKQTLVLSLIVLAIIGVSSAVTFMLIKNKYTNYEDSEKVKVLQKKIDSLSLDVAWRDMEIAGNEVYIDSLKRENKKLSEGHKEIEYIYVKEKERINQLSPDELYIEYSTETNNDTATKTGYLVTGSSLKMAVLTFNKFKECEEHEQLYIEEIQFNEKIILEQDNQIITQAKQISDQKLIIENQSGINEEQSKELKKQDKKLKRSQTWNKILAGVSGTAIVVTAVILSQQNKKE